MDDRAAERAEEQRQDEQMADRERERRADHTPSDPDLPVIETIESAIGDSVQVRLFAAGPDPFPVRVRVMDTAGSVVEAWLHPDVADRLAGCLSFAARRARRDGIAV